MSRVILTPNGVTLAISLLITDLLSPLGLQVGFNSFMPFFGAKTIHQAHTSNTIRRSWAYLLSPDPLSGRT